MGTTVSTAITPFTIDIPQHQLDDLRDRLERPRFAQDLPGVGWDYGTPPAYLQELVSCWKDEYDWRVWEAKLNDYPHFTTEIDGQTIHFLHIESKEPSATRWCCSMAHRARSSSFWKSSDRSPIRSRTAAGRRTPSTS